MRKLFVATATFAVFALLVPPALAAGKPGVTGTIALDQGGVATLSALQSASPRYGESVHFTTSVQGRMGTKAYVYVTVVCTQAGVVVYQWSADPGFSFPLQDQDGQGLEWSGGGAVCSGTLVYRDDSGRTPTVIFLDAEPFEVVA